MTASPASQRVLVEEKPRLLTAEEYYATCRLERSELINGRVVELMPPGFDHGEIAGNIFSQLKNFLRGKSLGRVSVGGGFRLQRDPDIIRSPDVSFVEAAHLEGKDTRGFFEGAPTIAVEVVSPGDPWAEVEDKTRLYLEKGARAVWIVEPDSQTIEVRTSDQAPLVYGAGDTLEGGDVLPGFQLPLAQIFE